MHYVSVHCGSVMVDVLCFSAPLHSGSMIGDAICFSAQWFIDVWCIMFQCTVVQWWLMQFVLVHSGSVMGDVLVKKESRLTLIHSF